MADYYQLKNQNIFNPPANTSLGNSTNQFGNAFVQNDLVLGNVTVTGATIVTPKVNTIGYPGDDTAADTAGGQTITLTGSGFLVGASVLINGSAVGVVSVVSSTTITFTSPANSTGSYVLYVINTDGGTAIAIPGIQYSGTPTWTTAAGSLGNVYETASFNQSVTATGDAPITYSLFSGSIPPGATFNSNGTITGTSELLSSSTTYTFTVRATDAEAQDTNRSFSLTINPDVVTWSSPANGTTYTSALNSAISNVTLVATSAVGSGITYTANALPTGLSLTGANISGTPTVEANSSSLLTATANTTSESSSITINWVISVANDIYFEYNTLLIPGASTTFVDDASTNNFAVTINGDTKPNSFNPYTSGYYSVFMNGGSSGDLLSFPNSSTAYNLSGGTWTVEMWMYPTMSTFSDGDCRILMAGANGNNTAWQLYINSNRLIGWNLPAGGVTGLATANSAFSFNTWTHVAVVCQAGSARIYVNGVSAAGPTNVTLPTSATVGFKIGFDNVGTVSTQFAGFITNVRINQTTAIYTANFTPSTIPLTAVSGTSLLTCQSNRYLDTSTNALSVTVAGSPRINSFDPFIPNSSYSTYGSGYFDGTGDYLTVSGPSTGSGTWTVEGWFYFLSLSNEKTLFAQGTSDNSGGYLIWSDANGAIRIYSTTNLAISSAGAVKINQWMHIAVVSNSNNLTIYVNGVSVATGSTGGKTFTNSPFQVNHGYGGPTEGNNCYITDVRLVNGTAVYTTTFTPPTAPLTAIANTQLLTLQNNQSVNNNIFLDNSTNNFLVTRFGNTTQGTFSPYGGNWSNYFDGSGDYLRVPSTGAAFSSITTFTYECWINPTAVLGTNCIFDISECQPFRFILSGSNVVWQATSGGGTILTATFTWVIGTWYHVAFVRSGSNISIFINGTRYATTTYSSDWGATGSGGVNIGCNRGDTWFFPGYISNARFVKGTAVYDPTQTTITVPTFPLIAIINTSLLTCQSNRFIDNSTNNFTITKNGDVSVQRFSPFNPSSLTPTSYSGYFDGDGDYLSASATALPVGSANYTIECWFNGSSASKQTIVYWGTGSSNQSMGFTINANGSVFNWWFSNDLTTTGVNVLDNAWHHLVATFNGTVRKIYVDGIQRASDNPVGKNTVGTNVSIGYQPGIGGESNYMFGYISNLRVVAGLVYDVSGSTITVPTTPLTSIANTSLLTLQSPTFIDNSTNNFTISAFGNSQPTQQNPFGFTSATTEGYTVSTIGGSGYFDGTGDYLTIPYNSSYNIALNTAFTFECWVYTSSTSLMVVANRNWSYGGTGPTWSFYLNSGITPGWGIAGTGQATYSMMTSSISGVLNQWNHYVWTRNSSNVCSIYVNGVSGTTRTDGQAMTSASGDVFIGVSTNLASPYATGYMSNMRFVSGTAVYTSNFVPSSAPLTAIQNTNLLINATSAGIYDAAMMTTMETVGDAKLSTAVSKFGGSSMSFDGSGDRLFASSSPNLQFGTGDFTVEYWAYWNAGVANGGFVGSNDAGGMDFAYLSGTLRIGRVNQAWDSTFSSFTPTAAVWYHIAFTRNSGTARVFVNGTQVGSNSTNNNSYVPTGGMIIGASNTSDRPFNGYIDDLRITKGYARYTSNFTAPTSAFPIF